MWVHNTRLPAGPENTASELTGTAGAWAMAVEARAVHGLKPYKGGPAVSARPQTQTCVGPGHFAHHAKDRRCIMQTCIKKRNDDPHTTTHI